MAVQTLGLKNIDHLFSRTDFTAYDFFRLFIAKLTERKIYKLERHGLVEKIYQLNNKKDFPLILNDIGFRNYGISISSQDIEDSISYAQTFGLIGKPNPTYEKIFIYITTDEATNIISEYNPEINVQMDQFIDSYLA